ncbi:MAG TPA: hypothetical protein VIS99_15240, partial [Terrimicrobiaceae bacterium]
EFESGKSGMTAQLAERQLRPVVVGKDGMGYEAHRWLESRTYRQDQQQNLLVADNRTDQYFKAESAGAEYLRRLAWNQTRMESVP